MSVEDTQPRFSKDEVFVESLLHLPRNKKIMRLSAKLQPGQGPRGINRRKLLIINIIIMIIYILLLLLLLELLS